MRSAFSGEKLLFEIKTLFLTLTGLQLTAVYNIGREGIFDRITLSQFLRPSFICTAAKAFYKMVTGFIRKNPSRDLVFCTSALNFKQSVGMKNRQERRQQLMYHSDFQISILRTVGTCTTRWTAAAPCHLLTTRSRGRGLRPFGGPVPENLRP